MFENSGSSIVTVLDKLCQAAWQLFLWHLVVKLLGGRGHPTSDQTVSGFDVHFLSFDLNIHRGLVVGHPQPSWRTRHPCTVDVLPGPTGVILSPG